jgi:hypothetical protein
MAIISVIKLLCLSKLCKELFSMPKDHLRLHKPKLVNILGNIVFSISYNRYRYGFKLQKLSKFHMQFI